MAIKSTVRIHFLLEGDVTVDTVYNIENPAAPGIVFSQVIPGQDWYTVFNPLPITGTVLSGLIVEPPRDNIHRWNLVTDEFTGGVNQSHIVYHPQKPSLFSIQEILLPIKISHSGPAGSNVTFRFIWF